MTLPRLAEKKRLGEPIVMVTAYDYPWAQVAQEAGVDVVLVGDSGAMTVLGYRRPCPVELDEMLMLARAVRRGLRTPLLIGDLPFGSYEVSDEQAIATAQRFVKEAGCDAVKLEGGGTPRSARARDRRRRHPGDGPRRADAADRDRARRLQGAGPDRRRPPRASPREALALQEAGCFAIVFEAIPRAVTEELMPQLEIPVIGIGAGAGDRRPGARVPRPARHPRRPRRALRQALRQPAAGDERRRRGLRRGRAHAPLSRRPSTPTRSTRASWRSCTRG